MMLEWPICNVAVAGGGESDSIKCCEESCGYDAREPSDAWDATSDYGQKESSIVRRSSLKVFRMVGYATAETSV